MHPPSHVNNPIGPECKKANYDRHRACKAIALSIYLVWTICDKLDEPLDFPCVNGLKITDCISSAYARSSDADGLPGKQ